MKRNQWQKISKLALTLTAAFGLAAVTNGTTQASHVHNQSVTQQVQKTSNDQKSQLRLGSQNSVQNPTDQNNQPSTLGQNDLIRGHHLNLKAKAAVAMDGRTGQVVYAKHANQKRLVASTGKLMTLYLAEKKLNQNPQAWHQRVRIARPLISMGHNPSFDAFHFKAHRTYSVGTLFKSTFIASDDNAAIALGQWVAGSNTRFIKLMNRQARKWHLRADFTSASGLENDDLAPYGYWVRGKKYSGNRVSAKSLAIIAYHLINDFPSVMKYSRIKSMNIDGNHLVNANRLLPGKGWYRADLGTDGLKTGYTPRAGLCLVGTAKKPGKDRLITVVLHDPSEFSETDDLIRFVYKYSNLYNH